MDYNQFNQPKTLALCHARDSVVGHEELVAEVGVDNWLETVARRLAGDVNVGGNVGGRYDPNTYVGRVPTAIGLHGDDGAPFLTWRGLVRRSVATLLRQRATGQRKPGPRDVATFAPYGQHVTEETVYNCVADRLVEALDPDALPFCGDAMVQRRLLKLCPDGNDVAHVIGKARGELARCDNDLGRAIVGQRSARRRKRDPLTGRTMTNPETGAPLFEVIPHEDVDLCHDEIGGGVNWDVVHLEAGEEVDACIAQLPEPYQSCATHCALSGAKYVEGMECNRPTWRKRVQVMRQRMRELLAARGIAAGAVAVDGCTMTARSVWDDAYGVAK